MIVSQPYPHALGGIDCKKKGTVQQAEARSGLTIFRRRTLRQQDRRNPLHAQLPTLHSHVELQERAADDAVLAAAISLCTPLRIRSWMPAAKQIALAAHGIDQDYSTSVAALEVVKRRQREANGTLRLHRIRTGRFETLVWRSSIGPRMNPGSERYFPMMSRTEPKFDSRFADPSRLRSCRVLPCPGRVRRQHSRTRSAASARACRRTPEERVYPPADALPNAGPTTTNFANEASLTANTSSSYVPAPP